jgi:hypothetical protein
MYPRIKKMSHHAPTAPTVNALQARPAYCECAYRPDQPTVNAPTGQTSQQNTSSFLADQHLRLVLEQDSDFKNVLILNVLTKEEYIII